MEDEVYYEKLQEMVDKAKELKAWIEESDDKETRSYLHAALEKLYADMRELIKEHQG